MSLRAWLQGWMGEPMPQPPAILTKEQVVERIKGYAVAHGREYRDASFIRLRKESREHNNPNAGYRYVYTMALGTLRPVPFVDVDAKDGTVLAWRTLPR